MKKVESPNKVTRRATRLSSSASITTDETLKAKEPFVPTLKDLTFGEEPISFDDVLSVFPGRRSQITDLVHLLGPLNSPTLPIMAYGSPSTGKTSVILQVFKHLNRPFVYASCLTCYSPRILFESVLNQLLLHGKSSSNGYSSAKRCEKPSDFINLLHGALTNVTAELKGSMAKASSSKVGARSIGKMVYLIFDNLELVREWEKGSTILQFLFSLHDILKMPEVGIVFISGASPNAYYSNMGYTEPIPLYFPEYSEDDLRLILVKNQDNRKLYSAFLDIVLKPFYRSSRRLDELSTAFTVLYEKYCEPLSDLEAVPNEDMKRRLFSQFRPHISSSLNDIFRVSSGSSMKDEDSGEKKPKNGYRISEGCERLEPLDFHMSTSAKYLLIAAFLASKNPATLDASMFDSTGGSDGRKRKRKASDKSMEKKEIAEQELMMKGPGSFPVERLIAIFQCIASVGESSFDEEEEGMSGSGVNEATNGLMSDVLLQLSSLCNANLIIKGSSCPLEGSTRYRSTISEDLALKVARSLGFPLSKYLYRR